MLKRRKPQIVRLLTDVMIPAGTVASVEPAHHTHYARDYVFVRITHGKDRSSEWLMPLDDAESYGLVSAPEDKPVAKPKARTT